MATTTTSSEAELIAEYWNKVFLNELRENLVFAEFGLKGRHATGSGVMVHWLSIGDLTAAASLSEGTDPTEYTLSAGDQTANLAQYGATVKISDLLQDTWQAGSMQELMERLGRNAALTIDTVIRDTAFTAGGSAQFGGTAVARNSIATDSSFDADITEIREAVNSLENNKAPRFSDGFYVGVVHPDVKYDLEGDTTNWRDVVKFDASGKAYEDSLRRGFVGELYGVRFMETTQALKMDASGSASTDVYQSYIFGPEQYGVSELAGVQTIVKNPAPASSLDLYGNVGWKAAFAVKELDSKRLTRLESGASLGD